jgi:uncharacterized membrane protein YphA (DoxX/SURF4 family)
MKRIALWIVAVLLAIAEVAAGGFKLSGAPMMVGEFTTFGYPIWFMYLTGVIEICAAVLVLIPRFSAIGAGAIACVMVGAFASHVTHGQAAMTPPVIVLFILAVTLGTLRGWRMPLARAVATA